MTERVRVLVADDEPMVCAHLRTILDASGVVDVVATAGDGAEAVEAAVRHRPDVVLLDLRMPGVDGFAALEQLVRLDPAPRVVVLTTFDADSAVLRALGAGAAGFLLKSTDPTDLVRLVQVAADGHSVLSPEATARLVNASTGREQLRTRAAARLDGLSERETDVLVAIGEGLSNAAIGARLYLSEATVKGYVSTVMRKLSCDNRTQAGLLAYAAGLVGLDGPAA
ncbi:response regulator transcription factor [Actinomycetospora endophytica]|uniref:Response regulator transcription factor n=1 Tax=Actinomycetospora endophytica TaxID=2291215 RepID=A0ABS8PIR1_9PSEU|nr:response regulator transcription factor [Actinomycetospora endophytica]MCD2198049.1 response regulator transcription factor [Actinomycetospora endophytica]